MKLTFIHFDEFFNGKGIITNHEPVDIKTKKFTQDGVFSETIFGKLDNEGVQYSCQCGKFKGKFFLGKKCDSCSNEVVFTEPLIKRIGWILLDEYYVVNPNFYNLLIKIIPRNTLLNIISFDKKLTKDGEIKADKNVYHNVGLIKFKEDFESILNHFYSSKKNKKEYYDLIMENKDKVFINKIPVFSNTLRPALIMKDNLIFDEINNMYNSVILNSNLIKNSTESERTDLNILPLLFSIQMSVNEIYDKTIQNLKGKTGFIRNNMMGSRVNFSARNVITPLPAGYEIDNIVLPYLTFAELYKFHLLNIICAVKNLNYSEANNFWNEAITHFNKELYSYMIELLNKTKSGLRILFNRNPSINFGSILNLLIVGIKQDYDDLTASISNNILAPLGGDYDGDTLNIIPLLDNSFKENFKYFNPKIMFISTNDGKYNSSLGIAKDQILGLYAANKGSKIEEIIN